MARTLTHLLRFAALAACVVALKASAQDFTHAGASTKAPPPPIPKEELKREVEILPDKKKSADEYLVNCGQACAFETAKEAMALTAIYFQRDKISTQIVTDKEHRENVKFCTENAAACRMKEDRKRMFLNSALHYNFGKFVRNAYVENSTNQENMWSIDYDRTRKDDDEYKKSFVESPYYNWYTGDSTYKTLKDKAAFMPSDFRKRDNFQFDLAAFPEKETDIQKMQELDPKFADEYRAFFSNYTPPNERFFAKVRRVDDTGRTPASTTKKNKDLDDSADFVYETEKEGKLALHEGVKRDVERGMGGGNESLKAAAKDAVESPDGKSFPKAPDIFKPDDLYFKIRDRQLEKMAEDLKGGGQLTVNTNLDELRKDPQKYELVRQQLAELRVKSELIRAGNVAKIIDDLQRLRNENKKDEEKGKHSRKIAEDLNQLVQTRLDESKRDGKEKVTLTFDIDKFDAFLEEIWPTDEGQKYLQQLRAQGRLPAEKVTISAPN